MSAYDAQICGSNRTYFRIFSYGEKSGEVSVESKPESRETYQRKATIRAATLSPLVS